jgi:GTP-binding protein
MFIDQVRIYVKAGDGGSGCVSFRREKYVPRGGPDGGNGGRGGDVVLVASRDLNTLLDLRYQQHYLVPRGEHGKGQNKQGRSSPDWIIPVPVGTLVYEDESGALLADLTEPEQRVVVAHGGKGGRGNAAFKTPIRQAPRTAEPGASGEARWLRLDLKLLADVGLVGFPNAGKSTLISRISSARPKIADYPFTTLAPHLGVVRYGREGSFTVADIPGLIEGAHQGKGLGMQFLRHVERTALLLFVIDISEGAPDPVESIKTLRDELVHYSPELAGKPFLVAGSKLDAQGGGKNRRALLNYCRKNGYDGYSLSAVTGEGVERLVNALGKRVEQGRSKKEDDPAGT